MKHNNFLSSLVHFVANGALPTPPCSSHGFLRVLADGEPTANRRRTDGRPTVEYTVQHTLRYACLLLTFILLTPSNMWGAGDNITFQGNETFYFDKASNSGWGHLDASDADVYLEFANNRNNKTKSSPAQWEKQDEILKVTVPSGTYNEVHIVRGQKGNPGSIWNEFDWIDLQTGKNQILNGGDWATYGGGGGDEPSTKTFQGGEVFYMRQNTIASDGQSHDFMKYGRCDFNLYDANGNFLNKALSAEIIPNTDPAILKFVVPAEYAGTVWAKVKVKQLETGGAGHNETQKGDIPTDGTSIFLVNGNTMTWSKPYTNDLWLVGGACIGQNWQPGGCTKMTNLGGGIYTITTQIKSTTADDGFKFKQDNSNWDNQWRPTESQATTTRGEKKVMVLSSNEENVSFQKVDGGADTKWQIVTDGDYTYTITIDLSDKDNGKMSIKKDDTPCTHPQSGAWLYLSGNTDLTGKDWGLNNTKLEWDCDEGVYYHTFTNLEHNIKSKYHFKIQKDNTWEGELNSTNSIDNNHEGANLDLLAPVNSNNEIGISLPQDADVTIYTNGSKVWAYADMTTPSAGDKTLYLNCKDFTGWPQHATTLAVWDGVEYRSFTKIPDCANDDLFVATNVHSASTYKFEFYNKNDNSSHSVSLNLTGTNNACKVTNWDSGEAQTITPNYTIHFNKNGHGSDIADRCVAAGSSTTDPQATATDGWVCEGWYTNDGLTNKFVFGTTTITAGTTLYAKWEQVEMVTVQFATDGGEPVPANQEIEEGAKATKPATDPAKAGYNFTGWDWNFDNTIDANKTITAQYTLKGVESVTLDKTELTMRVEGTTQKLTPTCAPEDVIGVSYSWAVTSGSAVSVSNDGVVSPLVKGTAVVTCTATNEVGISKTATCFITVKGEDEDCETIGVIYAEKQVNDMTQVGMFTESMNTEPKEYTKVQIKVGDAYAYVDPSDAKIKHGSGTTDYYYWYQIETGTKASCGRDMYLYKNVGNNKYLMKQNTGATNINWGWDYVITSDFIANDKRFEWYFKDSNDKRLVCNETTNSNSTGYSKYEMFLSRKDIEGAPVNTYIVCGSSDGNQGGDVLTTKIDNTSTVDNPNYLYPTVTVEETTYYRFANGAVVSTTLPKEMKAEDTIKVYYYATIATTAELRINGSKVDDIAASVGENIYKYVVKHADAGQTAVAVASNNTAFLMSEIKVSRPTPKDPITPVMNWDPAIDGTITKQVSTEKFTYEAVATKGAGLITYSSSNTNVATVNPTTGEVTMKAEGDAVITATMEQEGCYAEKSISYNLHLTDLPKPEITFVTVPKEMPQGLANQTIVVTTTGGDNFNLTITEGTDATLTINESTRTSTHIEATLSMGAEATNIVVLTASTTRTSELAQHAVTANVAVSACIPEGANIFEFTLTGSAAATNQPAIGGTVDQTALGTKGTEDNPAMVDVVTIKTRNAGGKYIGYDGGVKVVEDTGDNTKWYMIPAGRQATTSWGAGTYDLYYLYNKDAKKYLYRNNEKYVDNGDWPYYTTDASADASNARATDNKYTWFVYDSGDGKLIICGDASNLDSKPEYSYHLHTANQSVDVTNNHADKPAVPCGRSTDINNYSKIDITTTQAANPAMMKSVQYDDKTYYIISSEGSITLHGDFKAGDVVKVDTYDRKNDKAEVKEYEIQANADSYIYTTSNEYVCVNNIKVFRAQVGEMVNPTLTWDADLSQPQIVDLKNGSVAPAHVATPSVTTVETITYTTDNEKATVDAAGNVTLDENIKHNTVITVTATMAAVGCYNEATASYTIRVKNIVPEALQTMIDEAAEDGSLELIDDYSACDAKINKKLTINAQGHKIGNLTITNDGDLTLASAMTVKNFYIVSDQSAQQSGQLKNPANLTLIGDAYIDITFAPGQVNTGWYSFTVPFTVSATAGVYFGNTKMKNEYDYAIMEYQGDVRAQGKYGWIKSAKVGGILQAGHFYVITLGDTDYKTMRFMMTKGSNLAAATSMEIHEYASAEDGDAGWNGVGNPNLYHATAAIDDITKVQTYNHDNDAFEVGNLSDSHVVGTPYFVQTDEDKTMTTYVVAEKANAPARMLATATAEEEFIVDLELDGKKQDRIFLSASDEARATYEIGHDLIKMTLGTAKVAQMAINGYGMSLCDAEFMFDANNEAVFPLTLTAPKSGTYTLAVKRANEGQTITLLQNGLPIVMTDGQVSIDLAKGTTTEYSLVIGRTKTDVVTGNQQLKAKGEGVQKFILHNHLYIIKDNKVYDILGESGNR